MPSIFSLHCHQAQDHLRHFDAVIFPVIPTWHSLLTIIFQSSMAWFGRPFHKAGRWLTDFKKPEGLRWLSYFRQHFQAAPKNWCLSKLPRWSLHFPLACSPREVQHPCWSHLHCGFCYRNTFTVFLECTQPVTWAQLMLKLILMLMLPSQPVACVDASNKFCLKSP